MENDKYILNITKSIITKEIEKVGQSFSDHIRIDERSLAMHKVIAIKLLQNPALLKKAKDNIERWRTQGVNVSAFKDWNNIINSGLNNTIKFITSDTENSVRLRQSTPFTGILTPKERKSIYESFTIGTYYKSGRGDNK